MRGKNAWRRYRGGVEATFWCCGIADFLVDESGLFCYLTSMLIRGPEPGPERRWIVQRIAWVFRGLVALVVLFPTLALADGAEMQLVKTVGTGPSCPEPYHSLQVPQGTVVRYCYVVTNTGSVSLTAGTLHDDVLGDIPGTHTLAPGQSFTATLQQTATVPITNTATIPATFLPSGVITAEDGDVLTITAVSQAVGADGTVCTGDTTTQSNPVQTCATTPQGGAVSITVVSPGGCAVVPGFQTVGVSVNVTAPPATVSNPLVLTFLVDKTLVPASMPFSKVDVFLNGSLVPACSGAPSAIPDPCVSGRLRLGNGDVQITVLTSSASTWCLEILSLSPVPLLSATPQVLLIGLLALVGLLGLLRPLVKH